MSRISTQGDQLTYESRDKACLVSTLHHPNIDLLLSTHIALFVEIHQGKSEI